VEHCVLRLAESNVDDEDLHGILHIINGQPDHELEGEER